ncbi:MAG TPA: efflux RND transporter periplasmic adaptor subunit [Longimicrobiaceae bacterium]|nr:efflux RND transporter periplasmic adaptor subunit [Longimicrobiaceae bacterium]
MTKKRKSIIGAGLALLVVAIAGLAVATSGDSGVEVRTEAVGRRDLASIVTASGVIQPRRKVDISADIPGRVLELAVTEGQWVEEGDLLLRIDPTSFQAVVRRAEASVAQARAQAAQARANWLQAQSAAQRAEQLIQGDNLISSAELEQARTAEKVAAAQLEAATFGVAQAEATLSETRETLRKATIRAPMTGRVTRLNIEQGETAVVGTMNNPGSLLLTIADLSEMEASVKVDETDVPHISLGDSALVSIDAFPDTVFKGTVARIAHSAIQAAGASGAPGGTAQAVDFEVVIALDNPPEGLRPDLSATADVITATRSNVLAVPIISVTVRGPDGMKFDSAPDENTDDAAPVLSPAEPAEEVEGVFVVNAGKVEFVPVQLGIVGDQYFEVLSGLDGGEVVVAGPYQVIRDLEAGAVVRTEATAQTSQAPAATEEENG